MKRINYLSYLRAIACIAIVVLHTVNAAVILYADQISDSQRLISLSVCRCMMWAVPVFVMVTGALLLKPEKNIMLKDVFRKYILRVFLALLVFMILFSLFDTLMNQDGAGAGFLLRGLWNTLTGRGWAHLWYLYLLIGIYLLLVFYRAVVKHISDSEYRYLLLIGVIFLSLVPILQMWTVSVGFYIHVATIYPFYLFLGYALATGKLKLPKWLCVILIIVGIAGLIGMTILEPASMRLASGNLLGYSSIFVVLLASGIFSLMTGAGKEKIAMKKIDARITLYEPKKPNAVGAVLLELDRCSFGVYLIHMIFVRLALRYWMINPYALKPSILVFAGLIVGILIVSYGIVFLLKLIPGVRRIV